MLTKKGKYGLKALVHLAQLERKTAFVSDIAQQNNISKKFLDAILLELRKGGFFVRRRGRVAVMPCRNRHRRSPSVMP